VNAEILIVDDHDGFRARLARILVAHGFRVREAPSGAAALAAVATREPDLVVLDIQLPDIDGFEVAERLRAQGRKGALVLTSTRRAVDYGDRIPETGRPFIEKVDLSVDAIRAVLANS